MLRLGVARIAAGNKHSVDAWELFENVAPFFEREFDDFWIGVILVHSWIPDPDIQSVVISQLGHADHHLQRRAREMRAPGVIVRAGRD